jgi:hypothetical protein
MIKLVKKIMTLALAPLFMLSAGLQATEAVAEKPADVAAEQKLTNALNTLSKELEKAAEASVNANKPADVATTAPVEVVTEKQVAESVIAPVENTK